MQDKILHLITAVLTHRLPLIISIPILKHLMRMLALMAIRQILQLLLNPPRPILTSDKLRSGIRISPSAFLGTLTVLHIGSTNILPIQPTRPRRRTFEQPLLIPNRTLARFPLRAAHKAELRSTTTGDVIAAVLQIDDLITVVALLLPILTHQLINLHLRLILRTKPRLWVRPTLAPSTSLVSACGAGCHLSDDVSRLNEL